MSIIYKRLGLIILVFAVLILIIYSNTSSNIKQKEEYKKTFYKTLEKEKFYFSGIVISTYEKERGQGFLCLKKINTNKTIGYQFSVENNFVASVYENTIKYIGAISMPNSLGVTQKINIGDSVNYNMGFNKKITIYRNSKLIFERDAFIYKVHYNKKQKFIDCGE
ncbi:MAG: Uncharacterised protein [Formosa sp. Hel1_33_131]|nr:MAG: Uncharacterised protein [Formosa sp. Hel1_33_131]|tara:strand:+ start:363 stop:857 length:495 start_codon:yes stop_codon:yes gene_type:complete